MGEFVACRRWKDGGLENWRAWGAGLWCYLGGGEGAAWWLLQGPRQLRAVQLSAEGALASVQHRSRLGWLEQGIGIEMQRIGSDGPAIGGAGRQWAA